jgi:hypothetical protein
VDHALVSSSSAYADFDQDVCRRGLGVFDEHIEIPVLVKYAGIEQFVFWFLAAAMSVRLDEIYIRVCLLGVFIEILHIGVGWRAVELEIIFFDVLAVIGFAVGQAV